MQQSATKLRIDIHVECPQIYHLRLSLITPPPVGGRGIVFERFLSLFLCQQHYEKTAGPICKKFSAMVWSDHGTT